MDRRSDEIDFHFHLDRQLIDEFRSFHLHLHVEDSEDSDRRSPLQLVRSDSSSTHRDGPQPAAALLSICTPQQSYPTDVKSDSTGNYICAYVTATTSGEDAREVKAMVVKGSCDEAVLPDDPPATGTIAGHLLGIGYLPPPFQLCNFAFIEETNNLIPGAAANTAGTAKNCLAVWARFDGSSSWIRATTNFKGRTSTSVACEPLSAAIPPSLQFVQADLPQFGDRPLPQQYRVWLDSHVQEAALQNTPFEGSSEILKRLSLARPIVLSRDHARSTTAVPHWSRSCPRDGHWNLRVTQTPRGANAVLTCSAIGEKTLPSAVIWQAMPWHEFGANRMKPSRSGALAESGLTCMVEPA